MALLWLADVLRDAGLTVVEHAGWKTHNRPGSWAPTFGVIHATAAPRTQADSVQISVVRNGREDLPGPIANGTVDRQGRWHILSAGRCNSTLAGTAGPFEGRGNANALSTEACNDNRTEPWPTVQYNAYVVGWAAWCHRIGWTPGRLVGHKEHTPGRKSDPTFNMPKFRADVARVIAGEDNDMALTEGQAYVQHVMNYRLEGLRANREIITIPAFGDQPAVTETNNLAAMLRLVAMKVDIDPAELAQIRAAAETGAATALTAGTDEIVAGVLAGLDPSNLTVESVRQAVRDVLLHGAATYTTQP